MTLCSVDAAKPQIAAVKATKSLKLGRESDRTEVNLRHGTHEAFPAPESPALGAWRPLTKVVYSAGSATHQVSAWRRKDA
jgi:hypothetical protein